MRVFVRYKTPDEHGQTREERNAAFGKSELTPDLVIPEAGRHLWDIYRNIRRQLLSVQNGVALPVPWSEWVAYRIEAGVIVHPSERVILHAMDQAYCAELNIELENYRLRVADAQKQ